MVQYYVGSPSKVFWDTRVGQTLWQVKKIEPGDQTALFKFDGHDVRRAHLETRCRGQADVLLRAQGRIVDQESRLRLERAIGHAAQRASASLQRYARGEYEAESPRLPIGEAASGRASGKPVPFADLLDGWGAERRPAPKTAYSWRRAADQLVSFLEHNDAARLSAEDLMRWKAALISRALKPKTVRGTASWPRSVRSFNGASIIVGLRKTSRSMSR